MSVQRTASCACGQLSVEVKGDPAIVLSCSCTQCQKRTGSVFGVSAYFSKDQVQPPTGQHKAATRSSDAGRSMEGHFCPDCGSTVFWFAEAFPDRVGLAVGCFADPDFPAPVLAAWGQHKHHWVIFPEGVRQFDAQRR
jgi:hypothetical protein